MFKEVKVKYRLSINLHKHQLFLKEIHTESFQMWLYSILINTEDKSVIKSSTSDLYYKCQIFEADRMWSIRFSLLNK